MSVITSRFVVFITGAFLSNNCWDDWRSYFESKGYSCIAPSWPYKDALPEDLRNKPAYGEIASTTLTSLTDHFASIINGLPEESIIIGHSLGGLVVQLLLQRDLGAAGVAIHSFPPKGVNKFWISFHNAIWRAKMLFASSKKTYMISFNKWRTRIANGMTYNEQKDLYYLYAVPESRKVIRETIKSVAKINFRKSHAPLLFTSGGNDKLIPSSLNYSNYRKYVDEHSIIDYQEFKDHGHWVFGNHALKKEADGILYWLNELEY